MYISFIDRINAVYQNLFLRRKIIRDERTTFKRQIKHEHRKSFYHNIERCPNAIFDKIESTTEFIESKSLAIYWSLEDEVHTHLFIRKWCNVKQIYLPVIKQKQMYLVPYKSMFEESLCFKKSEQRRIEKQIDIFIFPGVGFDMQKNRVGRGCNFYRRYLKSGRFLKWGLCFNYQLFDRLSPRLIDGLRVDRVFTDKIVVD